MESNLTELTGRARRAELKVFLQNSFHFYVFFIIHNYDEPIEFNDIFLNRPVYLNLTKSNSFVVPYFISVYDLFYECYFLDYS